jgi:hypothetical protein
VSSNYEIAEQPKVKDGSPSDDNAAGACMKLQKEFFEAKTDERRKDISVQYEYNNCRQKTGIPLPQV